CPNRSTGRVFGSWFIRGRLGAPIAPSFARRIFVVRLGHHMDPNRSRIAEDPSFVQLVPPGRGRFVGGYDGPLRRSHTTAHHDPHARLAPTHHGPHARLAPTHHGSHARLAPDLVREAKGSSNARGQERYRDT